MDFSFDMMNSWRSGWQCDFHFGYGLDLIEEDALNENCCLQVLRILLSKADNEIDELESYLVSLQNDMALLEYDDWSEICCNALRKRIGFLDVSIKSLRNKDENDVDVHLLLHTQPAEKVDDIVKALLKSYRYKEDKQNGQSLDDVVINSKSPGDVIRLLENQKLSTSDLNVAANEEAQGSRVPHADNRISTASSSEIPQKQPYNSEIVEQDDTNNNDQTENLLAHAADHSDENKVAIEHVYSPDDKMVIQSSPSKSAGKRILGLQMDKSSEIAVNASNIDAKDYSIVYLNKKKKLAATALDNNNEEAKEESSISTGNAIILYSSPISVETMMDFSKEIQPANIPVSSAEMNKPCNSGFQVIGNEIRECHTSSNGKAATSNVPFFPGSKGSVSNTAKPASAMVKKTRPDALKPATGIKRNRDDSDSNLCGFRQKKVLNSDMDKRLCDIAVKAPRKQSMKEAKASSTDKMVKGKREDTLLVVKVEEPWPDKTNHSVFTVPVHLQAEKEKTKTSLQLKGGEIHLEENLSLKLSMVPPRRMAKTNIEANPSKELTLYSKEDHVVPHFLLEGEKQGQLNDCRKSISASRKKRKRATTSSPLILGIGSSTRGFDLSKLQERITDSSVKKECLDMVLYAGDSSLEPSTSVMNNLMELRLPDLRAIAKQQKLTKYHKLRKIDLIQEIVNRIG